MSDNVYKQGDWNAICDICGFKFKASQLRRDYDGRMVCREDWSPKHPQRDLRSVRDDQSVPWTRPEPEDNFIDRGPVDPDSL